MLVDFKKLLLPVGLLGSLATAAVIGHASPLAFNALVSNPTAVQLPYLEDFGDVLVSGCGAAWAEGGCEDGWIAMGSPDSVRMSSVKGYEGVETIMITPGTSSPNSVRRYVVLEAGEPYVRFNIMAVAVGGTADLFMRAKFFDPSGATVGVQTRSFELDDHSRTLVGMFAVPAGATNAAVIFGASNGSSGTEVALFSNDNHPPPCQECHYPEDWPPEGWGGDDCSETPVEPDPCECNISCADGSEPFHECEEVAPCTWVNQCECLDPTGICELGQAQTYD